MVVTLTIWGLRREPVLAFEVVVDILNGDVVSCWVYDRLGPCGCAVSHIIYWFWYGSCNVDRDELKSRWNIRVEAALESFGFVAQTLFGTTAFYLYQVLLYLLEVRRGFLELLLDHDFAEDLLFSQPVGFLLLLLLVGQLWRELALLLALCGTSRSATSALLLLATPCLRALFSSPSSASLDASSSPGVSFLVVRSWFLAEFGRFGVLLHSTMIIIQQRPIKI